VDDIPNSSPNDHKIEKGKESKENVNSKDKLQSINENNVVENSTKYKSWDSLKKKGTVSTENKNNETKNSPTKTKPIPVHNPHANLNSSIDNKSSREVHPSMNTVDQPKFNHTEFIQKQYNPNNYRNNLNFPNNKDYNEKFHPTTPPNL